MSARSMEVPAHLLRHLLEPFQPFRASDRVGWRIAAGAQEMPVMPLVAGVNALQHFIPHMGISGCACAFREPKSCAAQIGGKMPEQGIVAVVLQPSVRPLEQIRRQHVVLHGVYGLASAGVGIQHRSHANLPPRMFRTAIRNDQMAYGCLRESRFQKRVGLREAKLVRRFALSSERSADHLDLDGERARQHQLIALVRDHQDVDVAGKGQAQQDFASGNEAADHHAAVLRHRVEVVGKQQAIGFAE